MSSDGFEKVLIGMRGARETGLQGAERTERRRTAVLTSGVKQLLHASGAKLTEIRVPVPLTMPGHCGVPASRQEGA